MRPLMSIHYNVVAYAYIYAYSDVCILSCCGKCLLQMQLAVLDRRMDAWGSVDRLIQGRRFGKDSKRTTLVGGLEFEVS
jgi:hypothetical protein